MGMVLETTAHIAKSYPSITKVVLFGSRARGTHTETSDYDICTYGANSTDFTNFSFDVDDMDTFYKIDVLCFETITNNLLQQEILRDGVTIYERT